MNDFRSRQMFIVSSKIPTIEGPSISEIQCLNTKTSPILSKIIFNFKDDNYTVNITSENDKLACNLEDTTLYSCSLGDAINSLFNESIINVSEQQSIDIIVDFFTRRHSINNFSSKYQNFNNFNEHFFYILTNLRNNGMVVTEEQFIEYSYNLAQFILHLLHNGSKNTISYLFIHKIVEFYINENIDLPYSFFIVGIQYLLQRYSINCNSQNDKIEIIEPENFILDSQEIINQNLQFIDRIACCGEPNIILYAYNCNMQFDFFRLAIKYDSKIKSQDFHEIISNRYKSNPSLFQIDRIKSFAEPLKIEFDESKFILQNVEIEDEWFDGQWDSPFDDKLRGINGFATTLEVKKIDWPKIAIPLDKVEGKQSSKTTYIPSGK